MKILWGFMGMPTPEGLGNVNIRGVQGGANTGESWGMQTLEGLGGVCPAPGMLLSSLIRSCSPQVCA